MSIMGDGLDILKLINKGVNAELYTKVGKLIAEAQDLYKEREQLQQETKSLQEQLRFKGSFTRINGYVYIEGDDDPLCSRCADVLHKPVHLISAFGLNGIPTGRGAKCPECNSIYEWKKKRPAQSM